MWAPSVACSLAGWARGALWVNATQLPTLLDGVAYAFRDMRDALAEVEQGREIPGQQQSGYLAHRARQESQKHQPRRHQGEQHDPHRRALGIQPVGDPAGVDPRPPDRAQHHGRLQRAHPGEMLEQRMADLGDGEDEDEVEEQLERSDLLGIEQCPLLSNRQ